MGQIQLAVDDGPSPGIDRVLVRTEDRRVRDTRSAIAIVLWRIMIRVSDEQVAVSGAGKTPTRIVPHVFEFGLAQRGLPFGEICDRIIAADRKPGFTTPGCRVKE